MYLLNEYVRFILSIFTNDTVQIDLISQASSGRQSRLMRQREMNEVPAHLPLFQEALPLTSPPIIHTLEESPILYLPFVVAPNPSAVTFALNELSNLHYRLNFFRVNPDNQSCERQGKVAIKAYRRIAGMAPLDETFGNSDRRQSVRRPQDMARALYHKLNMHHQFEPLPFMLAGNHSLVHVAASALESMEVVPNHCVRNFSSVSNLSVAELVAPTMEAHFALQDALCAKRHDRARMQGMSLSGLHEVAIQLVRGNLAELMIASDRNIWGKLDRLNGKVTVAAKGIDNILQDDLLDDLAEVALAKGVRVTVVPIQQMPDQLPIAAILRPRFDTNQDTRKEYGA